MSADRHPNVWPDFHREPPSLPRIDDDDAGDWPKLARAYASMSAALYQDRPKIIAALEWLKARYESPAPADPPPPRGRIARVEDLEEAAHRVEDAVDQLEEIVTGQHSIPALPAVDSDRVRAIAAEEIERKENERIAEKARADEAEDRLAVVERAKRPWQITMAIVTAVLSLAVLWLGWLLTHK